MILATTLKNEFLKIKSSFLIWLILISSTLLPLINFLIQLNKPNSFVGRAIDNPWNLFFKDIIGNGSVMLFPFFIFLSIALFFATEHKADSWKKLFVLPINRSTTYIAKSIFILSFISFSLIIQLASCFIFCSLLGFIHSELGYFDSIPDISYMLKSSIKLLVSMLPFIALQTVLSFYFKNIIIPLGIGLFLLITGSIIAPYWEYTSYFPFGYNIHFSMHFRGRLISQDKALNMYIYQFWSFIYYFSFNVIGILLFSAKKLR